MITQRPELREQRTFDNIIRQFGIDPEKLGKRVLEGNELSQEQYSIMTDIKRKTLHFVPAFAIIGLWVFATRIWAGFLGFDQIWHISGEDFGVFLILTVGFSGVFVFAALEYVRFSYLFPHSNISSLLPSNVITLLFKAMKPREFTEFIKPVALILALVPIFFLPFSLFSSVTLGATLGDAAASIFGKAFGKTHWPKNSVKTTIGYFAGLVTTFLTSGMCLALFGSFTPLQVLLLAGVNAGIFLIIDVGNFKVDDNILNPLICGLGLAITYQLLLVLL